MARGQDAPTRTGGQIDPYVQSSIQQNKQLASNRLLTAMQEQGATARTTMQEQGASGRTAMQSQGQLQMQAAQSAQEDKRAAEAERGRRDDREFADRQNKAQQLFEAEQSRLHMQHEDKLNKGMLDEAEKIRQQSRELALIDIEIERDAADRTANVNLSIAKMMIKGDTERERIFTTLADSEKKDIEDQGSHAKVIDDTTRRISLDKRMDLPAIEPRPAFRGASAGMTFALPEQKNLADPMGIMQDQLAKYNPGLEVDNLSPSKIHKLEQQIMEGKIASEDIRSTLGVITAMKNTLEGKINSAGKEEVDFWREKLERLYDMEDAVTSLKNSKRQIKDSKMLTVGTSVRTALGAVYPGMSMGSKVSELKKGGMDFSGILNEMTKGREPYTPLALSPDMSPFATEMRTKINSIYEGRSTETIPFGETE